MARIKIAILGAGNMGSAMAHALAGGGREVVLWDFFAEVVRDIGEHRENRRFLPGVRLHTGVRATSDTHECVAGAALVLAAVPSLFAIPTLVPVLSSMHPDAIILNLAKGFAPRTRIPIPIHLGRIAPGRPCVHLAGPAIANEIARGVPACIILAAEDAAIAGRVADLLDGPSFIGSTSTDVAGAALGGILKNIYAILLGALDTLSAGARNLEAAALGASVQEMAAIASAHGGKVPTLYGLAGLGDLVATGFSGDSHNRKFGQMLAAGESAAKIEKEQGWLPEGARAAPAACALARAGKVRAPLAGLVRRWIAGDVPSLDGIVRVLRNSR
jgi:glycerol-3-phosphate dehydrogenase (NAD(P)+)